MYDAIKSLVEKCLIANVSFDMGIGQISSSGGLELESGVTVPSEACLVPENIGGLMLQLAEGDYLLRRQIKRGDKVIWLQLDGNFLILDRVGGLFDFRII